MATANSAFFDMRYRPTVRRPHNENRTGTHSDTLDSDDRGYTRPAKAIVDE